MYYNFAYSFQYPSLQLSFPIFVVGIQTQVHGQVQNFQSSQKVEEKVISTRNQQLRPVILIQGQDKEQKRVRKTKQVTKKQELPVKVSIQKKRRQADSFTQRRNILPNNINHILAFIQRKSKSEQLVERIIAKSDQKASFTAKRYYCYQTYLKQKLHIHVNKDTLNMIANHLELTEDIFTVQEQLFYNRVCRTLICYYIRQMAKLKILSSARVKSTNKLDHLRAHRTLMQYLLGNFEE